MIANFARFRCGFGPKNERVCTFFARFLCGYEVGDFRPAEADHSETFAFRAPEAREPVARAERTAETTERRAEESRGYAARRAPAARE